MKPLKDQIDAKIEMGRKLKPDFMKRVDEIIAEAKAFQIGKNAINLGQQAPNFMLPNFEGTLISMADLLKKGPLVVSFYRGNWCPYCNLQLRALQDRLAEFKELGAEFIAISPQIPDGSMNKNEIQEMEFIVLSDQDAKVASEYGIAWEVPKYLTEHMRIDRMLNLEKINNGNSNIMPIPATFVIGRDGIVTWSYVDVDYRTRSEPQDIIDALKRLS